MIYRSCTYCGKAIYHVQCWKQYIDNEYLKLRIKERTARYFIREETEMW